MRKIHAPDLKEEKMREPSWYLRSYEYVEETLPNGKIRKKEVYTGEYYHLRLAEESYGFLRAKVLALCAVTVFTLLLCLSRISRGASLLFVGGAAGISLFPAIYLVMGCICFCKVPYEMTYRELCQSVRRIRRSAKWMLPFTGLAFLGEAFYLFYRFSHGLAIAWAGELLWLLGMLFVSLLLFTVIFLFRRYDLELCPIKKGAE